MAQNGGGDPGHAAVETYCFQPEVFVEPHFTVEGFIKECKLRVPMAELKVDLDKYHDSLQSSMFTLINKDYGEFLSLSSNLAGLDKSIREITTPLGDLQTDVQKLKDAMDSEIAELEQRIARRTQIRDRKALCQKYLNISASIEKIEKLLAGAAEEMSGGTAEEALSRGSGELIERVASEFNQLQFYATQCDRSPFLDALGPRISSITALLQKGLELSFRRGLEEGDREVLRQCLRTYSIIDKVSVAETLFRDIVVTSYAHEHITQQAVRESGLQEVYADILKFVEDRCAALCSVAAQLNITACDFVVNAVWPVVAETLSHLSIFASGIADEFHSNYSTTMSFLDEFELLCGSRRSVERLRAHPAYGTFCRRWSLPVYFQLRFQEIAGAVEGLFSEQMRECGEDGRPWRLTVGNSVILLIKRCWAPNVFLQGLTHRFWKLTLQILSRYAQFVTTFCDTALQSENRVTALLLLQDTGELQRRVPEFIGFVADAADESTLKVALDDASSMLDQSVADVRKQHCQRLVKSCSDILQKCGGVPRQYRHTGRKAPTEASDFMRTVFDPLLEFKSAYTAAAIGGDFQTEWEARVFAGATAKYKDLISQLLISSKEMEEQLQRVKKLRKGNPTTQGMSDDDKIRLQLWLDVKVYVQMVSLNPALDADTSALLEELQSLVEKAKPADAGGKVPTISTLDS
eukprot:m.172432 g.172432  ORF g.172432 m.172432 type:complete len:692 (+) comp14834_c0_seq4:1561-3636(+)